jgi:hypothetical protein
VDVEAPTRAVERAAWLDGVADAAAARVAPLGRGGVRRLLSGEWQGHPLHPLLTDLPVGFWTTSFVLDLVGGRSGREASQRCIGLGLLSVPATAAAGWSDWLAAGGSEESERAGAGDDAVRRTGVAHAALNGGATVAYAASWLARRQGRYGTGVAWGMAGATFATAAGHLGGHLIFRLGAGVAQAGGGSGAIGSSS